MMTERRFTPEQRASAQRALARQRVVEAKRTEGVRRAWSRLIQRRDRP